MPATKSLKEMIETDVQFSALKSHLTKSGLMDKLAEPGQWTLFAPNNKAFSKLDAVSSFKSRMFFRICTNVDIYVIQIHPGCNEKNRKRKWL